MLFKLKKETKFILNHKKYFSTYIQRSSYFVCVSSIDAELKTCPRLWIFILEFLLSNTFNDEINLLILSPNLHRFTPLEMDLFSKPKLFFLFSFFFLKQL